MPDRCVLNIIAHAELDPMTGAGQYDESVLEQALLLTAGYQSNFAANAT